MRFLFHDDLGAFLHSSTDNQPYQPVCHLTQPQNSVQVKEGMHDEVGLPPRREFKYGGADLLLEVCVRHEGDLLVGLLRTVPKHESASKPKNTMLQPSWFGKLTNAGAAGGSEGNFINEVRR
jgi:hypothetical protein